MTPTEIRDWIDRHPESLPRRLEDLARFPMAFRRIFAAPAPNAVMTEWERRIRTAFSPQEAGRVFMLLGPPEPPEGIPLPADALPTPTGAH